MPKELFQDHAGEWRYRIKGKNHEPMATSEGYSSKSNADRGYKDLVGVIIQDMGLSGVSGKYGIADLAQELGRDICTVRALLRRHNIPKMGKCYEWKTKAELNQVVKALS